jgi:hypothetical protein
LLWGVSSAPEPLLKGERGFPTRTASSRRRKPCQLTPSTVGSASRPTSNAAETVFSRILTNLLAWGVRYELASGVQWISRRQFHGGNPFSRMHVGDPLVSGQSGTDEDRTIVVSEILRLVRPRTDKQTQVDACRDPILVEVEGRKTVGRVPAAPGAAGVAGIQRVGPSRICNPPPHIPVG